MDQYDEVEGWIDRFVKWCLEILVAILFFLGMLGVTWAIFSTISKTAGRG